MTTCSGRALSGKRRIPGRAPRTRQPAPGSRWRSPGSRGARDGPHRRPGAIASGRRGPPAGCRGRRSSMAGCCDSTAPEWRAGAGSRRSPSKGGLWAAPCLGTGDRLSKARRGDGDHARLLVGPTSVRTAGQRDIKRNVVAGSPLEGRGCAEIAVRKSPTIRWARGHEPLSTPLARPHTITRTGPWEPRSASPRCREPSGGDGG